MFRFHLVVPVATRFVDAKLSPSVRLLSIASFIADDDYMQSTAVVITILVKNSVDHDSPTVLMARAWESEFIRTVLNWRATHPEVVVSFAAEVGPSRVPVPYSSCFPSQLSVSIDCVEFLRSFRSQFTSVRVNTLNSLL